MLYRLAFSILVVYYSIVVSVAALPIIIVELKIDF